ncbi:MAG: succinate dehydrogenase iron-sulfur subunit [Spirochaetales bacterium]|nr:succinate dehydrogenase iron-sulfur subunit [Spirochaetales bacterium]
MNVVLDIRRFNPEDDRGTFNQTYDVEVDSTDRVLDALMSIKRGEDRTLTFRKSCAHGICGSDAMLINGKERLACKTLIQEVAEADGDTIHLEPLRHLAVERDLIVRQISFFKKFESVRPFLIPKPREEAGEYLQTREERSEFDDATKCILCQSCVSSCPVPDKNPGFIGPASIVQAARFVFDSRDAGFEERLAVLDHPDGVWACENHFECTRVCPRGIKITKLINLTKRKIQHYRKERGEQTKESGVTT